MFLLGILSISLLIGYLIGASNSPVVGAFITAIIGFAGIVGGAKYIVPENKKDNITNFIGILLVVLASGIFLGELSGEAFRRGWFLVEKKTFLWDESNKPSDTREAIDWIIVAEKLKDIGYNHDQIKTIYEIRTIERKRLFESRKEQVAAGVDDFNLVKGYDDSLPFNEIIENVVDKNTGSNRGPASVRK